jgi:hypothetical protein
VILDSYKTDERAEVHAALERILSPDQRDWSPKGVYAYWNRQTHEILYLGLASNLADRFAQHNGLVKHGGGNKTKEINAYFEEHDYLGFTILIQSKAIAILEQIEKLDFTLGTTAKQVISGSEGQLIEMHRLATGKRPPWNGIGGAKEGKSWATAAPALLDVLAARRRSLFVARRRLRELPDDLRSRFNESTIHAARMRAMIDAHDIGEIPKERDDLVQMVTRSLMLRDGHLVEDLDVTDDTIRRWIKLLGDPETWRTEAAEQRARLEEKLDPPLAGNMKAVADFLDSILDGAAPPAHISATEWILSSGYLDEEPVLPPAD